MGYQRDSYKVTAQLGPLYVIICYGLLKNCLVLMKSASLIVQETAFLSTQDRVAMKDFFTLFCHCFRTQTRSATKMRDEMAVRGDLGIIAR